MKGILSSNLFTRILQPFILVISLIFVGCQDDMGNRWSSGQNSHARIVVSGNIQQQYNTRATDMGFVDGDKIGVFIVNYEKNHPGILLSEDSHVSNMRFVYSAADNAWTPTKDVYWMDDKTPVDAYGYYPFKEGLVNVDNYKFEVQADQSLPGGDMEMSSYEASDFLWAKDTKVMPGTAVHLDYTHRLAGVKVVLKPGKGFAEGEWQQLSKLVMVKNSSRHANINLSTGVATVVGQFDKPIQMAVEKNSYRAVVVPQTIEVGNALIGIDLGGKSYDFFYKDKKEPMVFLAGKMHLFTIEINKRVETGDYELQLMNEEILPWQNDESSHKFEANSYVVIHVEKEGTLNECIVAANKNPETLKNMKVTGRMTTADFDFIKQHMPNLISLNMKEVKLVNCFLHEENREYADDVMPAWGLDNNTSLRRVVLPDTLKEIGHDCFHHTHLTSILILPEGLTHIHGGAFDGIANEVVLPTSLEYIGGSAFYGASSRSELNLSDNIKYIGGYAFYNASNFYGTFRLPSKLEFIGESAFTGCGTDIQADVIEIPQNITIIRPGILCNPPKQGFRVKLHDGIVKIVDAAFSGVRFAAPLHLPDNLEYIDQGCFKYCTFRGEVVLPRNLRYLGSDAFCLSSLSGKLVLPEHISLLPGSSDGIFSGTGIEELVANKNLEQIGIHAFNNCGLLRRVRLEKFVNFIGDEAFAHCNNLDLFTCLAPEPPRLGRDVFAGVDNNRRAILEVPEQSVELYRNTPGWNMFHYITAYHELAFSHSLITCLNKGITREGMLRTEGAWSVKSCPEWVELDVMSGDGVNRKTEILVKVKPLPQGEGPREGKIVFTLKDKAYTTYCDIKQYDSATPEDTEIVLQKATAGGRAIPIFILGDGFDAESVQNGAYLEIMKQQMEHLFAIEPYKTYRNYFTVSTALSVSPKSGVGVGYKLYDTKFESFNDWGVLSSNSSMVKDYVCKVSTHINRNNLNRSLIIMMHNVRQCNGNTYRDRYDGTTIAFCPLSDDDYPYDQRGVIQYEVGGVAFGRLGSEGVSHLEFIRGCTCAGCNALGDFREAKSQGDFENLSLSGKVSEVPWKHLIFHPKYSAYVDVYEGGYNHARGVFRSEVNSCMKTHIPYYNAISRESIVKRIMDYAGKPFSFEEFEKNDKMELPQ